MVSRMTEVRDAKRICRVRDLGEDGSGDEPKDVIQQRLV